MPFPLVPSTPPGTPAAPTSFPGWRLSWLPHAIHGRLLGLMSIRKEPLDAPGVSAVVAFCGSSLSAAAALLALQLAIAGHYALYAPVAWVTHNIGPALWGLAAGAGFMSESRLPRLLAWSVVLEAVLFYGWDRLNLPGNFHPWNMLAHVAIGTLIAFPAALASARRWLGKSAP